ncbi:hypothetical protein CAPTEDRAFT_203236 [Capitella teleta]|uniref:Uncharacterized protein n=1 Tax=Capitella teleta TaxID=283909 RepID=R7U109_CAPTE|nr:hypothetical protein CAPTEDRAFT_203236 [Capitella teleta]|eukprot:ELT96870.1 hypothetical protein CAPTEDRAFT_203236 [Capitella teleta]
MPKNKVSVKKFVWEYTQKSRGIPLRSIKKRYGVDLEICQEEAEYVVIEVVSMSNRDCPADAAEGEVRELCSWVEGVIGHVVDDGHNPDPRMLCEYVKEISGMSFNHDTYSEEVYLSGMREAIKGNETGETLSASDKDESPSAFRSEKDDLKRPGAKVENRNDAIKIEEVSTISTNHGPSSKKRKKRNIGRKQGVNYHQYAGQYRETELPDKSPDICIRINRIPTLEMASDEIDPFLIPQDDKMTYHRRMIGKPDDLEV